MITRDRPYQHIQNGYKKLNCIILTPLVLQPLPLYSLKNYRS
jgi:hypothetical protein